MMPGAGVAVPGAAAGGPVNVVNLLVAFLAVAVGILLYRYLTRQIRRHMRQSEITPERALRIVFIWRYAYMAVGVGLFLALFSESLTAIGLTLALVSTLLGWALKPPIMNLAGWIMLITQRPYGVGDRVIMGGYTGDVQNISVFYTELAQVGGTVSGDEKSGRTLLLANMHLFDWTIVNYTRDGDTILDEVPVRITYDSDIDVAEVLMIAEARRVLEDEGIPLVVEPYVRHEFIPSGIVSRIRYHVPPRDRQEISSLIVSSLFSSVTAQEGVRFCHVQSEVHMRAADPELAHLPPPPHASTYMARIPAT